MNFIFFISFFQFIKNKETLYQKFIFFIYKSIWLLTFINFILYWFTSLLNDFITCFLFEIALFISWKNSSNFLITSLQLHKNKQQIHHNGTTHRGVSCPLENIATQSSKIHPSIQQVKNKKESLKQTLINQINTLL